MDKRLLFSLTKKDFEIQTFRAGGKGGQNQNSRDSAVRIIHPDSGARGESREHREQAANRKAAFERLVKSWEFKKWHMVEVAKRLGIKEEKSVDEIVDEQMREENLKVEFF